MYKTDVRHESVNLVALPDFHVIWTNDVKEHMTAVSYSVIEPVRLILLLLLFKQDLHVRFHTDTEPNINAKVMETKHATTHLVVLICV